MSVEDLPARIRAFLRVRGAPASGILLAERFLRTVPRTEAIALRLLDPLLAPAGLVYLPDTGWWFPSTAPGGTPPPGPESPAAPRLVACAVALAKGQGDVLRGPIAGVHLREIAHDVTDDRAGAGGAPRAVSRLDWKEISRLLDGAEAVFIDPGLEAPALLAGLSRRSLLGPSRVRSLAGLVRGAARIARGGGVEEICQAFGAPFREGGAPADASLNIEACVRAAAAIRSADSAPRDARAARLGRLPGAGAAEGPASAARRVLTPTFLSSVPARPGVYRFFDEEGKLLYVGKAADLRRRLSTYASRAGGEEGRSTSALARLARVEFEVSGSELEALLKEARTIFRRHPLDNVQREVHERGRVYAAARRLALLLPSSAPGTTTVIFLDGGRYEGSARLGPRGGGIERASAILRRLFSERPRRRRGVRDAALRDTEILNSWLSRNADAVSRLDLDSSGGAEEALRKLRAAADSLRSGDRSVSIHR